MSAAQSNQPQHGERPTSQASTDRLAELVAGLTDCSQEQAVAAIEGVQTGEPADADAALEVVARAMTALRRIDLTDTVDVRDSTENAEQHTPIA